MSLKTISALLTETTEKTAQLYGDSPLKENLSSITPGLVGMYSLQNTKLNGHFVSLEFSTGSESHTTEKLYDKNTFSQIPV